MFTNILQVVFNMSDVAVVGKFAGPIALGAVGSTSILITLFTGILIGLASGVNALTALYIGSKDTENVKRTVHTSAILCLGGRLADCNSGNCFFRSNSDGYEYETGTDCRCITLSAHLSAGYACTGFIQLWKRSLKCCWRHQTSPLLLKFCRNP